MKADGLERFTTDAIAEALLIKASKSHWSDGCFLSPGGEQSLDLVRIRKEAVESSAHAWLVGCAYMHDGFAGHSEILEIAQRAMWKPLPQTTMRKLLAEHCCVVSPPPWPEVTEVQEAILLTRDWNNVEIIFSTNFEYWIVSWGTSA